MVYYKLEPRYSRLRGPLIIHEFWMVIMVCWLTQVLAEDQKDAFKDFIKEKVREAKKAQREARQARKKAVEEMDEETKAAYEKMRFYKFYPVQTLDVPDISQVKHNHSLSSSLLYPQGSPRQFDNYINGLHRGHNNKGHMTSQGPLNSHIDQLNHSTSTNKSKEPCVTTSDSWIHLAMTPLSDNTIQPYVDTP
ncbi:uncharacterized protein LOC131221302 [Magnolia sinica]|uniref:uncharacterized protein LOC131221302 n=1 Tax=Magnolia sinica TaxID=86752 RepID=UPI00265830D9|nr:uncharacterized protein LOC131221302 [Magnolia sinica]XP_058072494.1 uncharacterized protein LOC131221302 [Magnolia sinica]